MLALRF